MTGNWAARFKGLYLLCIIQPLDAVESAAGIVYFNAQMDQLLDEFFV